MTGDQSKWGQFVPTVDPEDMKSVWQLGRDLWRENPQLMIITTDQVRTACKPGTNIEAVCYRGSFLWMMWQLLPEEPRFSSPFKGYQPDDAIFRACAEVAAKWRRVGKDIPPEGPPFDVQEFLRLCEEVKQ